jgi:RNA polymerase sigma factor (sigma-70 family)
MTSDSDLLKEYLRSGSEESFRALVERHVNLVYSAALRRISSPEAAEEVVQSVFTDLARSAHRLEAGTVLSAWLYEVTRRTAIDLIRRESRRHHREQVAHELSTMHANTETTEWAQVEPLLEEAMDALDASERTAVLLRYFKKLSLRDVGLALGTSEDAAQKRVSRAVEQMREFFARRGVAVGAGALVGLISTHAVQGAPAGLAAGICGATALAGTASVGGASVAAIKVITMSTLQKTVIGIVVAGAVGTALYEAREASGLRDENNSREAQRTALAG